MHLVQNLDAPGECQRLPLVKAKKKLRSSCGENGGLQVANRFKALKSRRRARPRLRASLGCASEKMHLSAHTRFLKEYKYFPH